MTDLTVALPAYATACDDCTAPAGDLCRNLRTGHGATDPIAYPHRSRIAKRRNELTAPPNPKENR